MTTESPKEYDMMPTPCGSLIFSPFFLPIVDETHTCCQCGAFYLYYMKVVERKRRVFRFRIWD